MRWLLIKDLQILRRSPLQAVLLVAYPVLIAILVGFAISRGPEKPRVAFLNEVPQDTQVNVGGDTFDVVNARNRLCERLECVRVQTRQQAIDKVKSGDVLGALILPSDLAERINSLATGYADLGGPLGVWKQWCLRVEGQAIDGGHFFPEELPEQTAEELGRFCAEPSSAAPAAH